MIKTLKNNKKEMVKIVKKINSKRNKKRNKKVSNQVNHFKTCLKQKRKKLLKLKQLGHKMKIQLLILKRKKLQENIKHQKEKF